MKPLLKRRVIAVTGWLLLASASTALAQSLPPPLPPLTARQAAQVRQTIDAYRRETDERVARGEVTPDEAQRLIAWREWQVAQQAAGNLAPPGIPAPAPPVPPDFDGVPAVPYSLAPPPAYVPYPYYARPYYAPPYYAAPPPFYWGFSLCAGRAFHNGWGSLCI
jgi:DNA-binding transcriptional regulator YdaS (Cro superfamily)